MNDSENTLRAARFENPERIPVSVEIASGCWDYYPQSALQELMGTHPILFPGFRKKEEKITPRYAPWRRAGQPYTDSWGCVWETAENGITGAVVKHALADWDLFKGYLPPSPEDQDGWGPIDWASLRKRISEARTTGRLARGELRHGHTFLTLTYLRSHVRNAVEKLGSREGGLMLKHGLFPGVPLENIRALMDAMEKYSQHFS